MPQVRLQNHPTSMKVMVNNCAKPTNKLVQNAEAFWSSPFDSTRTFPQQKMLSPLSIVPGEFNMEVNTLVKRMEH